MSTYGVQAFSEQSINNLSNAIDAYLATNSGYGAIDVTNTVEGAGFYALLLYNTSPSPGGSLTLTGNTGGAVGPTDGNINVIGDGTTIDVVGDPGTSTLTISYIGSSSGITTIDGDTGSATGSTVTITGGATGLTFSGSGSTLTLEGTASSLIGVTDTTSPFTTALGSGAAISVTSLDVTAVGFNALNSMSDMAANNNTAVGYESLKILNGSAAINNCALGAFSGMSIISGGDNTFLGHAAGYSFTGGNDNTCIGKNSGDGAVSGSGNVFIGSNTASGYTGAESSNILIGFDVTGVSGESNALHIGDSLTQGLTSAYIGGIAGVTVSNINVVTIDTVTGQLGSQSLGTSLTGITDTISPFTTALGSGALPNATGITNTAVGYHCLQALTTGTQNCALGVNAGLFLTGASMNTLIGQGISINATSGDQNTIVGSDCTQNIISGSINTILGCSSGDSYSGTESNNILIGANVDGIVGESDALHIGDTGGGITATYIAGIAGVTVSNAQIVTIDTSTGQLGSSSGIVDFPSGIATAPVSSATATAAWNTSLTAGTSYQNTNAYDLLVTICVNITTATTATLTMGVGPATSPTTQTVVPSFTIAATSSYTWSAYVPASYYLVINTTGTITIGSITTMAMGI